MAQPDLDIMMPAYADVFVGSEVASFDIPNREKLVSTKLDWSLESLKAVDAYLEYLHNNKSTLSGDDFSKASILAGAYVGEVIIKLSNEGHHWSHFSEYAKKHPKILNIISEDFYTQYLLVNKEGAMALPINKIARFIDEGPENSLYFYSVAELK